MMDDAVRNQILHDLIERSLADPEIPYWVLPILRTIQALSEDITDIGESLEQQEETQVAQQKALTGLKTQYSELLYHMKSNDK